MPIVKDKVYSFYYSA